MSLDSLFKEVTVFKESPCGRGGGKSGFRGDSQKGPWEKVLLSGPLDRLNAILSLLHPLDRYRTPSAIVSAIGGALSRPISHPCTGGSSQPPRSKPLRGLNRAIVVL